MTAGRLCGPAARPPAGSRAGRIIAPPRLPAAADGRWEYPVLAQTARSAGPMPPEEEFGQGLAIVLRGFRAMLAGPSP
jgi:hypothetical protein